MKNIFPKSQGGFVIRSDFKSRKALNRILIQMQSTGVVQRLEKLEKKLKKNYDAEREYKVYSEGVQFDHVRYIVYGYSCAVFLSLMIVVVENVYFRIKYGRDRQEKVLEKVLKGFSVLDEDLLEEIIDSLY